MTAITWARAWAHPEPLMSVANRLFAAIHHHTDAAPPPKREPRPRRDVSYYGGGIAGRERFRL